jgi:arylsulfatase A-like enzyme
MVRWPGRVVPASVCEAPVTGVDFYPTLLEISGAKPDPRQKLDGLSLVPLLEGGRALKRECIYWHFPHYLLPRTTPVGAIRGGDYKLIEFFEDGKTELYNLGKDIGETTDLSAEMPAKAAELRAKLHAWRNSAGARMPLPNPAFTGRKA